MADLETQIAQALVHLQYLREDVTETKSLVKEQNGKVRRLEGDVRELKTVAKTAGRNHGAGWGAGGGVLGGLLAGFVQHWMSGGK